MSAPAPKPDEAAVAAMELLVLANARMAYAAYRNHRVFVEGGDLPDWDHLCERKRERFLAVARANMTFNILHAAATART